MNKFRKFIYLFILLCSCIACNNETTPQVFTQSVKINVMFSPGGLGDLGYNDLILNGFLRLRLDYPNVCFVFYTPDSIKDAETIVSNWISEPDSGNEELFVLASSDYENMIRDILANGPLDTDKDLLLMESPNTYSLPIRTLRISIYGASYLASISAAADYGDLPALVVGANPYDKPVLSAIHGFMDGWQSATQSKVDTVFMASDWNGFIQSEKAYHMMDEWRKEYGFVFPVAGGTNNGIYRYLREHPESMKTAGMDTDQSYLCSDIIGSVIKHIDQLVYDSMSEWIETGDISNNEYYGLHDGYAEWLWPESISNDMMETAIRKEYEYEHQ